MKLYTKKGDDGTTGLIGNVRVPKNDARVSAYGAVDETNAAIGLALASITDHEIHKEIASQLSQLQADLFVVGAELATPEGTTASLEISANDIARLEDWIDEAANAVPELKTFILPGGCPLAASLHFARGVCRRSERDLVTLMETEEVGENVLLYLNRLADLLFALARDANAQAGVTDIPWNPSKS